jgi:23S rRNA (guanosine2251-2'-O)-methyltransferase
MVKLNSKQLRSRQSSGISHQIKRNEIYIILDNVLDTYNIGSIFRLADAVGAKKLILCGGSETPPNPRIKKASINTTTVVDWEYFETTEEAIKNIKDQVPRIKIVAVEQAENSVSYDKYDYQLPIALVVGHETEGVSVSVLELVDEVVEMPMYGINISLNVVVSLAVVLFKVLETSKN